MWLYTKYLVRMSILEYIWPIDPKYLLWLVLFSWTVFRQLIYFHLYVRTIFRILVFKWACFSKASGFRQFAMKWSSDPHLKHVFCFRLLRLLHLLLELRELKGDFLLILSFLCCLKSLSVGCDPPQWLHLYQEKFLFLYLLPNFTYSSNHVSW